MAVRTTASLVKGIVDVDDGVDLSPFIEAASMMVDDNCLTASYTDAKLEVIERWLAAHCFVSYTPRVGQEGIGTGPHVQYDFFSTSIGLDNTKYGQMAMRLDPAGGLALMNNAMKVNKTSLPAQKKGVGTKWVGTKPT